MSADGEAGKYRPTLTRKIGVGLTRSNLIVKNGDWSSRNSKETTLTAPRVIISASSLTPKRTPSDRYQSGYSRLGDLRKNTSAPNVSLVANSTGDRDSNFQADVDIGKDRWSTPGRNLPVIATPTRLSHDTSKFDHIQEHDSQDSCDSEGVPGTNITETDVKTDFVQDIDKRGKTSSGSKVKNYDIDLEQDEADVWVPEIKFSGRNKLEENQIQQTERISSASISSRDLISSSRSDIEPVKIDVTSHYPSAQHSPSKDSGYGSPRTETSSNAFATSVTGARSETENISKSDQIKNSVVKTKTEQMAAPERPVRIKSLARKLSGNLGKVDRTLSPRQPAQNIPSTSNRYENETYGTSASVLPEESDTFHLNNQNPAPVLNSNFVRGNLRYQCPSEKAVAALIRRSSRRLTRKNTNFKRLVRVKIFISVGLSLYL